MGYFNQVLYKHDMDFIYPSSDIGTLRWLTLQVFFLGWRALHSASLNCLSNLIKKIHQRKMVSI